MAAPVPDRLADGRLKIERSVKHVADLEGVVRAFLDAEPYKVGAKDDPHTGEKLYYVTSAQDSPRLIPLIAGEVIQALRSALDYLAYQLWKSGIYEKGTDEHRVFFPISDDAAAHKSKLLGMVRRARKDVVDAIDAVEPYKGGKGQQLWVLHKLNNIDKHRLLIVAGAGAYRSMNVGPMMSQLLQQVVGSKWTIPVISLPLKPADRLCPLKAGDVPFRGPPHLKVDEKTDFAFEVAFNEPGIAVGDPLLETVHQVAQLVGDILTHFEPLF